MNLPLHIPTTQQNSTKMHFSVGKCYITDIQALGDLCPLLFLAFCSKASVCLQMAFQALPSPAPHLHLHWVSPCSRAVCLHAEALTPSFPYHSLLCKRLSNTYSILDFSVSPRECYSMFIFLSAIIQAILMLESCFCAGVIITLQSILGHAINLCDMLYSVIIFNLLLMELNKLFTF